jgi:hypothetical protein
MKMAIALVKINDGDVSVSNNYTWDEGERMMISDLSRGDLTKR